MLRTGIFSSLRVQQQQFVAASPASIPSFSSSFSPSSFLFTSLRTHYSNFLKAGGFARTNHKQSGPIRRRTDLAKKAASRKARFQKQMPTSRMMKGGS